MKLVSNRDGVDETEKLFQVWNLSRIVSLGTTLEIYRVVDKPTIRESLVRIPTTNSSGRDRWKRFEKTWKELNAGRIVTVASEGSKKERRQVGGVGGVPL